jgi:glucosamine--fructose-6-phosphate aminotransferase (isomerizing)
MCGIVAAAAGKNIVPVLVEGLKKLEYRGYDSAGLAVIGSDGIERVRSVGRVAELETASASTQLGHRHRPHPLGNARRTLRTQCPPTRFGLDRRRPQRHHRKLRKPAPRTERPGLRLYLGYRHREHRPSAGESTLKSEPDLFKAVQDHLPPTGRRLRHRRHRPYPARQGRRRPRRLAASARRFRHRQLRRLRRLGPAAGHPQHGLSGKRRHCRVDRRQASKSPASTAHRSSARCMSRSFLPRPSNSAPTGTTCRRKSSSSRKRWPTPWKSSVAAKPFSPAFSVPKPPICWPMSTHILILACGTSSHSGYTARYWLEAIAGVTCNVEIASEYRYRTSVANPRQLIVAISQSGETADTLAACATPSRSAR